MQEHTPHCHKIVLTDSSSDKQVKDLKVEKT